MSDISTWSAAAGGNTSPSPDGAPEGMAPSGVNDTIREMMAAIKRWYNKLGGANTKIVEIGDWDMDAAANTFVIHGLDSTKIRAVQVFVRNDSGTLFNIYQTSNFTELNGCITTIDATYVNLSRSTGGYFDSALFDSTSYNRGWITITYVD